MERFKNGKYISQADDCVSINSSKANPSLQTDCSVIGVRVVYPTTDGNA
ncbi:MAG: hypothetical protein ACLS7B_06190 [Hominilimicola sp.]